MNILILALNYLPESTSMGPYTADLAEFLRARGHDARVVTGFPTAPQWKVWKGYEKKWFFRELINGVPVQRTYLYVPKDPRKTLQRILFDSSFAVSSLRGAVTRWRPESVVVVSPPLQLALTGLAIGAWNRAPVFLHIQDLVPDAAIAVGAMRPDSVASRAAHALERFVYRRASGIGVICDGMRRNLTAKGVPEEKVAILPNYVDMDFMRPQSGLGFRERFGVAADEYVVMYTGSVAGKQGLQTFVEAAAEFEEGAGIACRLAGEGAYLPELQQLAGKLALRRFRFLPLQQREAVPGLLYAADALVITQRKAIRDMVFPGKLLYYMAAGKPILAAVSDDSETGRFIREHDVGMVVPPEDPPRLAEAIRWMRANPERTREFGRNARRAAETHFDRRVVLERFAAYIEGGLDARCLTGNKPAAGSMA